MPLDANRGLSRVFTLKSARSKYRRSGISVGLNATVVPFRRPRATFYFLIGSTIQVECSFGGPSRSIFSRPRSAKGNSRKSGDHRRLGFLRRARHSTTVSKAIFDIRRTDQSSLRSLCEMVYTRGVGERRRGEGGSRRIERKKERVGVIIRIIVVEISGAVADEQEGVYVSLITYKQRGFSFLVDRVRVTLRSETFHFRDRIRSSADEAIYK